MINQKIKRFFGALSFLSCLFITTASNAGPKCIDFINGDYDKVIQEAATAANSATPANYFNFANAQHMTGEELFYTLAALDPFEEPFNGTALNAPFKALVQGIDLNAAVPASGAPTTSFQEALLQFIKAREAQYPQEAKLVKALLNLNTVFQPAHATAKTGLDLLEALVKENYSHAFYWKGIFKQRGIPNLLPKKLEDSIPLFKQAGRHIKAIRQLNAVGSESVDMPDSTVLNDVRDSRDAYVIEKFKEYKYWSGCHGTLSSVWEWAGTLLGGAGVIVTFIGSGLSDNTLTFVGASLGTGAIVLEKYSRWASNESQENTNKLNKILRRFNLDVVDDSENTTLVTVATK